ncbi:MAG: DUF2480 family protein [Bacteroidetes bacterium]|nr:MAG: DUF2480 family protein [Bacteroidota bacterium]
MTEMIRNKVQESGLINMDLADFKPNRMRLIGFDLKDFLWQELVLKEKDFRARLKEFDWNQFEGKSVFVHCSADAIVPTWAFMLVSSYLSEAGVQHLIGGQMDLEKWMIREKIGALNPMDYQDGRIIIKGCSDITAPEFAMTELLKFLQPLAKSIMYGEPCSTVPIYKRAKAQT